MPRRSFFQLPIVRAEVREALAWTKDHFGAAKAREYSDLARLALRTVIQEPESGRHRPDVHPDAWIYEIKLPGHNARHLFLYEIVDGAAHIYGFLYDGRDLPTIFENRKP